MNCLVEQYGWNYDASSGFEALHFCKRVHDLLTDLRKDCVSVLSFMTGDWVTNSQPDLGPKRNRKQVEP